nr:uncharacterized protein LOC129438829 isoform X2 [Misgurnus anguillicaudatus]
MFYRTARDTNGKHDLRRQDKVQLWEDIRRVNPPSQNPITGTIQRNFAPFKSDYQSSRINPVPYNQRNDGNTKKTSFSSVVPSRFADVKYYHTSQANVNSKNNPLELTSVNSDAKNRYAFQRLQQKPSALHFTGSQKSDTNTALRLAMEEGLGTGMHHPNVHTYGLFSKPNSEMHPVQQIIRPVYAEKISTDYVSRNLNVNHNNDQSILYDYRNNAQVNGQNERTSRKIMPVSKFLNIVRGNNKVDAPLSHDSSTGTKPTKVSDDNMKRESFTKVFAPQPSAPMVATAFTKSHSDRNHSIIPLIKAQFFSVQVGQQDYKRTASPIAIQQSSFESKNTKINGTINASKGFQRDSLTATQNGYWNGGSRPNPIVQNFHSQWKYDSLAADVSAITPPVTNIAHSYKGFQSVKTSAVQSQTSVASSWPKQNIAYNEKAKYSSPKIFSTELKTNIKLPITSSSLGMTSRHNTGRGNSWTDLGRSTEQSLFVKNYPDPMPDNTVSAFDSYKNSDTSSSQNRPYYLTSKKPYAFKGFTSFPTMPAPTQQTEMHFDQKHQPSSLSYAVRYASARPHTAPSVPKEAKHLVQSQNPSMSNRYKTTQSAKVQLDAVNNRAYGHVSFTGAAGNKRYDTPKMMTSSLGGTKTSTDLVPHNSAIYPQNNQRGRYKSVTESKFDGSPLEMSQRWTLGGLAPSQNTQSLDESRKVLQKSSQSESTLEKSTNGRFARPNSYRSLFIKSSNVNSVSTNAGNALNARDSTVATGITNPLQEFPTVYRKMGLSQSKNDPISEFVPSIHRSVSSNKVTGYPLTPNSDVQKNFEANNGLFNLAKEMKQDRTMGGLTQLKTNKSYNAMRLGPTSSIVIGRRVEASQDGKNSDNQNIYGFPTSQSAIYRSASIRSHKANNSAEPVYPSTIHRSVIKPIGKDDFLNNETASISVNRSASEMDIDLSAVGVSQTSRPTSSFVVGKSSVSKTKGLHNYKPVRFADVAGTASFSGMKPSSVDPIKVALKNISSLTPGLEESLTDLSLAKETDNFTAFSDMGNIFGSAYRSTASVSVPGLVPTAVTTEPQSSFTAPQTTAYSFEPEPNPGNETTPTADGIIPFDEDILIPNTTMLVTMTSV